MVGVGRDKKYCKVEEFKNRDLPIKTIDISKTVSELNPFIKNPQQTLGDW